MISLRPKIATGIDPRWLKIYISMLIVYIVMTLVEFPAGRSGWVSPLCLAISIWLVSLFCRWPIPDGVCSEDCECDR